MNNVESTNVSQRITYGWGCGPGEASASCQGLLHQVGDRVKSRSDMQAPLSVVAWFCESQKSAFKALLSLQDMERTCGLQTTEIVDAAVMRESDGKVCIDRTIEFREHEGRLGVIFPASVLEHCAVAPDVHEVAEHFSTLGLRVNLLREIGENLPESGSALVMLLEEGWLGELRDVIGDGVDVERWGIEVDPP
jgi:hypothetical protein